MDVGESVPFGGHHGPVVTVAVTPDGHHIITGGVDGGVGLWDWSTGELVRSIGGHHGPVVTVAISPDRHHIITGGAGGVGVWELATGELVDVFDGGDRYVRALELSPDGDHIVAGGDEGIHVWNLHSHDLLHSLKRCDSARVSALAVSPDGEHIIAGNDFGELEIWRAHSGKFVRSIEAHDQNVHSVAVSPNGQNIITGGEDGICIWRFSGHLLRSINHLRSPISAAVVAPDGRHIITGNASRLDVWDRDSGDLVRSLDNQDTRLRSLTVSPDGHHVVSGGDNGVRVWNLHSGYLLTSFDSHHRMSLSTVAASPDGRRIITGSTTGSAGVWATGSGELVHSLDGHNGSVRDVAVTPDGRRVITCCADGVHVWSLHSGELVRSFDSNHRYVDAVTVTPDGRRIVSGGARGEICLWNLHSGELVRSFHSNHQSVSAVAVSPDGRRMISSGSDGIRVWNLYSGELLHVLVSDKGPPSTVTVTADRHRIVCGIDGGAQIWDLYSGELLHSLDDPNVGSVWTIAVSPDGRRIFTGDNKGGVHIWDAETGAIVHTLDGHWDGVSGAAVLPYGGLARELVTVSREGTIRIWDLRTGIQVRGTPEPSNTDHFHAVALPDSPATEDLLRFGSHVDALARLVAAVTTTPPFAIALLAEWGGGKSSFMRLLGQQVDALSAAARSGQTDRFVRYIRVITFDAWHYSDTSVLLGIVSKIFRELHGRPHGTTQKTDLLSPQQAHDARRKAQDEVDRLKELEEHYSDKDPANVRKLWRRWNANVLLLPRAVWAVLTGRAPSAVVAVVGALPFVAAAAAATGLPSLVPTLSRWLAGVGAALTAAVGAWLLPAAISLWKRAGKIRSQTTSASQRFGWLRAIVLEANQTKLAEAEEKLQDAKAADAIGRLSDLIRDPAKQEELESHRGIVGLIEDRLGELSEALQGAGRHASRGHMDVYPKDELDLHVDRIILHIDDLDRCPPERVVDVLHAIALLNTAPLFVVVVSVDPRWLRKSLTHHEMASFSGSEVHHKLGERVGNPLDYLDKIFQIPYAIPRATRDDAGAFLTDLATKSQLVTRGANTPSHSAETQRPPEKTEHDPDIADSKRAPHSNELEFEAFADRLGERFGDKHRAPTVLRRDRHHSMKLDPDEVRYLSLLAGTVTTPRAVKKILNLYQLVRLGRHMPDHADFAEEHGGFRQAALLLAILIGAPAQAAVLFRKIDSVNAPVNDLASSTRQEHLTKPHEPCTECAAWDRIVTSVEIAVADGAAMDSEEYRKWTPEISRFSFHTENLWQTAPREP